MDLERKDALMHWGGGGGGRTAREERFVKVIQHPWHAASGTFMYGDVYANGAADECWAAQLTGLPRDSYCLVESPPPPRGA